MASPANLPKEPSSLPFSALLTIANTIIILGAAGFLYYSKLLYKRPAITEEKERERLVTLSATPAPPAQPIFIHFEPLTINILGNTEKIKSEPGFGGEIPGKIHYVTFEINLEINDGNQKALLEEIKPLLIDKMITLLGKKTYYELSQVQGRYILRSQILESANELVRAHTQSALTDDLITHAYFSQFIIQ
jgi:flagellar basal body-associated protein FliL